MGETAGEPVHMVDADSNFCKGNVDRMINSSAELSAPKASYAVVSIVGAQSSGKSYLMNRLFGTKFPEMDASLGWRQTSRGIMLSRCIRPSLLLLDVEGFDGKGQGRERTKLQGAGFTKILVVLRDNFGETPLETLKRQLLESMQEIWEGVNNKSVKFNAYIEMFPEFQTEVTKLRQLLSDNRSSKVPASGFSLSSSIFWDAIKKNKELDIPTHQVTLARLYCRQLVEDIIKSLNSQEEHELLKAEESPARFREISHELLEKNKAAYDLKAEMYDPNVRGKERQYLVDRLHEIFTNDSREVIRKVQEITLDQFKGAFYTNVQNMKEADADLYFKRIMEAYIDKFMSSCEDLKEFDSDYLRMIYGELKKKMRIHVKVRIARLYCQQLVKDILHCLTSNKKYKLLKDEDSPLGFKGITHELLEEIKTEYDLKAEMYDPNVRGKERQYLVDRLHEIFTNDSREIIRKVQEITLDQFKGAFYTNVQNMKEADADLYFKPIMEAYIDKFMSSCEDLKEFDSDYLRMIYGELKKKMQSYTALNIVEVKVRIARLYCQQLVKDILHRFTSNKKYKLLKDEDSPLRFKGISHELLEEIKTEYNKKTKMYDRDVRDQERQCLEERLHENIKFKSQELIWKVKKKTIGQYRQEINGKSFKKPKDAQAYFERTEVACISYFMSSCECSCEDEKVFDSAYSIRICGEVKKKLQSYTSHLVKEHERITKEKNDLACNILWNTGGFIVNSGIAVGLLCIGSPAAVPYAIKSGYDMCGSLASVNQTLASTAQLVVDDEEMPSTSQDHGSSSK